MTSGRRSAPARAVLLALLMAVFVVQPPARPAGAAELFGHDISWPQCGATNFNLPSTTQFVIIGLTRGLAFTENPCLADQVQWVTDRGKPNHAYAMGTFPTDAQLSTHGGDGPWQPTTRAARLSNTGYAAATFAVASMTRIGWRPPMVWIDVESRPAQEWPTGNAARERENRYVLEGMMRGFHDAGFSYGTYANASGWAAITGGWYLPTVPVWATAGTLDRPTEALEKCTERSFSGGRVYIAQWWDAVRDYDRTCSWYSFTPPQMPPAIMTGSLHDWNADWTDDVVTLDLDDDVVLWPGDGHAHIGTGIPMAQNWAGIRDVIAPGDFSGDRRHDLLGLDTAGRLWLYRGNGHGGLGARTAVTTGWSAMREVTSPGDFSSDGRNDVLALDTSGRLWLYRGTDTGGVRARTLVTSGWTGMRRVVGAGDMTGDRRTDVLALTTGGVLYLYPGNGTGGLGTRIQIASGFGGVDFLMGGKDVDGDRMNDVLVANRNGLAMYPGEPGGQIGSRVAMGLTSVGYRDMD